MAAGGLQAFLRLNGVASSEDSSSDDSGGSDTFAAWRGHFEAIITMGALLLGFTITGTILSVSVTGDEDFSLLDIMPFVQYSLSTMGLASLSTLIAFIVSNHLAVLIVLIKGVPVTLCVAGVLPALSCLCESLIFASMGCFIISIKEYSIYHYTGPNICPYSELYGDAGNKAKSRRYCADLGVDLHDAAKHACEHVPVALDWAECSDDCWHECRDRVVKLRSNMSLLCQAYNADSCSWELTGSTGVHSMEYDSEYFAWTRAFSYTDFNFDSQLGQLADLTCGKSKAVADEQALCAYHDSSSATSASVSAMQRQACAQAMSTLKLINDCVDETIAGAIKCAKVCGRRCVMRDGKETCKSMVGAIREELDKFTVGCKCFLALAGVVRLFFIIGEAVVVYQLRSRRDQEPPGVQRI